MPGPFTNKMQTDAVPVLAIAPVSKPRLLVIDDESEIRDFMHWALGTNFNCLAAESAEDALELMREHKFDVVLSDITMPGMGGLELIRQIKNLSPDTVVVMISGRPSFETAISATRLGAFDYLMKPFEPYQLRAVVERAAGHHQSIVSKKLYEQTLERLVRKRTRELNRTLKFVENAYRSTLQALTAAIEARDSETHGHSERVVTYSLRLGREYGLNEAQLKSLEYGALLHDIGKIGVPDAILRKPAKLTDEEWALMRQHPLRGQLILTGIDFLQGAAQVVAQHHEKWDGGGYPLGLRGEQIDLCARIFAVADAFDAMTSDRVYKRKQSHQDAVKALNNLAGIQFDPGVVAAFNRIPRSDWKQLAVAVRRRKPAAIPFNQFAFA